MLIVVLSDLACSCMNTQTFFCLIPVSVFSWSLSGIKHRISYELRGITNTFCVCEQIIEVKFEKFDLERDNYCRYDYVAIFNGGEINDAKRIGKYCGDSPPA